MGVAKLNVWVRNEKCEVVNDRAHMHVYDCHGKHVLGQAITGHTEVALAPGCYIVTAGLYTGHGNVYTDKTMVVVGCDEKECVNLVLNRFREDKKEKLLHPVAAGCAVRIVAPLYINAKKAGIPDEKLMIALETIMTAANIDPAQMGATLMCELREIEEEVGKVEEDELAVKAQEFADLLKEVMRFFGK